MKETTTKFEPTPAIVALMGHQKIAGIVSEASFPSGFLRVDVPAVGGNQAYTRFINPKSLYDMHPVSMETMLAKAAELECKPIDAWDIKVAAESLIDDLIQKGKISKVQALTPCVNEDEMIPHGKTRDIYD
jgi:hypothetical protein